MRLNLWRAGSRKTRKQVLPCETEAFQGESEREREIHCLERASCYNVHERFMMEPDLVNLIECA